MGKNNKIDKLFLAIGWIFLMIAVLFFGILIGVKPVLNTGNSIQNLVIQNTVLIMITGSLLFAYINILQYGNEKEIQRIKQKVEKQDE